MLDRDPGRDRQVRHAQLVAEREVGDVDDDRGRDVAGQRLDGDGEEELLEDAAFLRARRLTLDR